MKIGMDEDGEGCRKGRERTIKEDGWSAGIWLKHSKHWEHFTTEAKEVDKALVILCPDEDAEDEDGIGCRKGRNDNHEGNFTTHFFPS